MEHKQTQLTNSTDKKMFYTEFTIPRKNKTPRRIVAPSASLKAWQKRNLRDIEPTFTAMARRHGLEDIFHGFVKGRNAVSGAEQHVGKNVLIMMDLSNFFDTIFEDMLPSTLRDTIPNFDRCFHKDGYAAQGFVTSPMLANIAIIKPIYEINQYLRSNVGEGNYSLVVYADDISLGLIEEDNYKLEAEIIEKITEVMENRKLSINKNKTRIKRAKFGAMRCLGVNIVPGGIQATRKTIRKLRSVNHLRKFDKSKHSVYRGLKTWSGCYFPKGYKSLFSL